MQDIWRKCYYTSQAELTHWLIPCRAEAEGSDFTMATPLFVVSFTERWEGTVDILVQFAAQNEAAETKAPVKFYMCLCLKQLLSASLVIIHYGCLLLSEKEVI